MESVEQWTSPDQESQMELDRHCWKIATHQASMLLHSFSHTTTTKHIGLLQRAPKELHHPEPQVMGSELLQSGALATTHTLRQLHKQVANICHQSLLKWASCMFGKQTNCAKPGEQTSVVREQEGVLSAKKPHPGQSFFVDHFVCSTQGRKFDRQDFSKKKAKCKTVIKGQIVQQRMCFCGRRIRSHQN